MKQKDWEESFKKTGGNDSFKSTRLGELHKETRKERKASKGGKSQERDCTSPQQYNSMLF